MAAITVVCAVVPSFRKALPYAWRSLVYPSVGCIVANIPVIALILTVNRLANAGSFGEPESFGRNQPAQLLVMASFLAQLVGPAIASLVGFVLGAILGINRAARAADRAQKRAEQA